MREPEIERKRDWEREKLRGETERFRAREGVRETERGGRL